MVNWIKKYFKRYMIQPIIVQTVVRTMIAVILAVLWDRLINRNHLRGLDQATGCFALVFFALAWFSWLSLDGVEGPVGVWRKKRKEAQKKNTSRRAGGDIADYIDEDVVSFDDLQEDEKSFCRLASNLFSGLILLVATGVLLVLK